MAKWQTASRWPILGGAILLLIAAGTSAASEPPPALGLPLDCVPGRTCWIVNYVDHDPGPARRDYRCGGASYDGHQGTDFAVRDLAAMRAGVAVLAAAPGTVAAIRDGMADRAISSPTEVRDLGGKDCGNGVVVTHADGWSTQYCHLRRGSVAVGEGQVVARGDPLGLVGLSGRTEFPHLHLTVRKGETVIDPFVGPGGPSGCGPGDAPLWEETALAALPYETNVIYHGGFAGERPSADKARNGDYAGSVLDRGVPALVLWADLFNVRAGHRVVLVIRGPDGRTVGEATLPIEKDQARFFAFVGKPLRTGRWSAGDYEGRIQVEPAERPPGDEPSPITVRVTVR